MMNVLAVLADLADEHLVRMAGVPWASYADLIRERAPRGAGETFGCEVDGVYFDVGVGVAWESIADGDVLLTAYACTDFEGRRRVERTTIVRRP
jgi:hypothetical protein